MGAFEHLQKAPVGRVQQHPRDAMRLVVRPAPVQQGSQLGRAKGTQRLALVNEVIEVHGKELQEKDDENGPAPESFRS